MLLWIMIVCVAVAILFALAWWTSGRSKPATGHQRDLTETERKALAGNGTSGLGQPH